jgi:hypothetical protein
MDISSNQSESYSPFLLDDSGNMVLDASGNPIFIPQPLVYPDISGVDLSGYTNLLLINSAVADYQDFVTYANSETFPVVFSLHSTREELLALVSSGFSNLSRIGLVFETNDNGRVYPFLNTEVWFMDSDLENVEPFSPNMQFMISLIQTLGILNIDYLACDTLSFTNWVNYPLSPYEPTEGAPVASSGILLPNVQQEMIRSIRVLCDGNEIQEQKPVDFFTNYSMYRYSTGIGDDGLPFYSFQLDQTATQPSGSINASRIRNFQVELDVFPLPLNPAYTYDVNFYVENLNFFEVASGMGGLKYAL